MPKNPNDLESIIARYKQDFGKTPDFIEYLAGARPELLKAYARFRNEIVDRGVLPRKYQELIILGIVASKQFHTGIERHMLDAHNAGATEQEILETIWLAVWIGGMPSYISSLKAIRKIFGRKAKREM